MKWVLDIYRSMGVELPSAASGILSWMLAVIMILAALVAAGLLAAMFIGSLRLVRGQLSALRRPMKVDRSFEDNLAALLRHFGADKGT